MSWLKSNTGPQHRQFKRRIQTIAEICTHYATWTVQNTQSVEWKFYSDIGRSEILFPERVVGKRKYTAAEVNTFLEIQQIFEISTTWRGKSNSQHSFCVFIVYANAE